MRTTPTALRALAAVAFCVCACANRPATQTQQTLVFRFQSLWGNLDPFDAHLKAFERANPGWKIILEPIPNSSDVAHQTYLTALEGGATEFDLMVLDVVWIPEFGRAGWLANLASYFSVEHVERDFLPSHLRPARAEGGLWAIPWYADVGLLYYRTDLVPRAPKTYDELKRFAKEAMARTPGLRGYLWQAKQYEGLVCNAYEAIWGHGGKTMQDARLALDTDEAKAALSYLHSLLDEGISPSSVISSAEEESRRPFQNGEAVFMRNWPYAWVEAQAPGSKVAGKVAFAPLPTVDGRPGSGTLGGWYLALNAKAPVEKRAMAAKLVEHLTSVESNVMMAIHYGRNPPRRAAYEVAELKEKAPFIAALLPLLERAEPRPVTPYYLLLSDVLQGELSAAVTGIRPVGRALERAQALANHRMGVQTP